MKNQNEDRPDKDFFTGKKKLTYDPISLIAFVAAVLFLCAFIYILFHLSFKNLFQ